MMKTQSRKKILHIFLLAFCICAVFKMEANAAGSYQVTEEKGMLQCKYDGQLQLEKYLSIKKTGDKYQVVKPCTTGSKVYFFDYAGDGEPYTGNHFVKITYQKSTGTYYSQKGVLQKNKIVGDKKEGYYYVDSTGRRVETKEITQAVKFVRAHTKSGWSKSKKLQACYKYLWKNYTYQRFYDTPKASKMSGYANYMFKNKKGNCYRYAASFACIARVIGYESRVACGSVSSTRGGMTPHGWTEVKVDGKWYICDANMQKNWPKVNSYMRTEKTYAYRHICKKRYKLTVKNGKVSWK
ncbi:MAG: transglutaminase-like domain-containing protein [Clostridium sp.]|nr:transglutaminase-like domain-containing protein [Clostridium sp.]